MWFRVGLCALLLPACQSPLRRVERSVVVMGTRLDVVVDAATGPAARRAAERAIQRVQAADVRWSTWRDDSLVARLHAAAPGRPVAVDEAFRAGWTRAVAWSRRTGGAFDPSIGGLLALWAGDGRSVPVEPPDDQVRAALAACGTDRVHLSGSEARRIGPVRIASGGFAKGLALDAAMAAAEQDPDVAGVLFDFGGQIVWRLPAARPSSRVGIAHPDRREVSIGTLALPRTGAVATSGNSERGIRVAGRRRSHIFDPRTGRPAPDWGAVTVLVTGTEAPGCAADCLSTACFVLGPRRALALAATLDGVEVLCLERLPGGAGWRWHMTPGMRARVRGGHDAHEPLGDSRFGP